MAGATLYDRPALAGDGQVVVHLAAELQVLEGYAKPAARTLSQLSQLSDFLDRSVPSPPIVLP